MISIQKPELSPNFTVEDIRKLRKWYDSAQAGMTPEERVADTARRGEEALVRLGLAETTKRLG